MWLIFRIYIIKRLESRQLRGVYRCLMIIGKLQIGAFPPISMDRFADNLLFLRVSHPEMESILCLVVNRNQFNYPERVKRVMFRFNRCCLDQMSKSQLLGVIDSVSEDGDFSIVTSDDSAMAIGIEWDNVPNLKKGKTVLFWVTLKANVTFSEGDFWIFGGLMFLFLFF